MLVKKTSLNDYDCRSSDCIQATLNKKLLVEGKVLFVLSSSCSVISFSRRLISHFIFGTTISCGHKLMMEKSDLLFTLGPDRKYS